MKNNLKSLYSSIPGASVMAKSIQRRGGAAQQDRMIKDKRDTLDRAVLYSYQSASVRKVGRPETVLALINPNKLKQDYDDKILSIGFEFGYKPGDVFEWLGTDTHWLIYLQDLTELAYFRGDIRKCSYEIAWMDDDGKRHQIYAAVRGPIETKINFIQKHGISVDNPNYTLNILMPKTDEVMKYFKRYSKFYLNGDEQKICWKIAAIDSISTPGIVEINAVEYYANETEDNIEDGTVGSLIVEPIDPTPTSEIVGETFIKVKKTYEYIFNGEENLEADWFIDSKYPILWEIDSENPQKINLKWDSTYCGQFDLYYGDIKKTIVVESLF